MWIEKQYVESVRSRCDWAVVLAELGLRGKAVRGEYRSLCPFHAESHPSFYFQLQRGLFYCHGCSSRGDGFSLVMRRRGLSFPEAVEWVAALCSLAPVKTTEDLLGDLAQYYHSQLCRSGRAQDYLRARGVTDLDLWRECAIGYAPGGRRAQGFLRSRGYSIEQIRSAGLINRLGLDLFFRRLTFPLSNSETVANLYGRNLTPDFPHMYLPGTRDFIFGIEQPRNMERAILVEGIFDFLTLRQLGYHEAITGLSANLSGQQVRMLHQVPWRELIIAFDSDPSRAGAKAAKLLAEKLSHASFQVRLASLPNGRDVNDCLVKDHFTRADFDYIFSGALPC